MPTSRRFLIWVVVLSAITACSRSEHSGARAKSSIATSRSLPTAAVDAAGIKTDVVAAPPNRSPEPVKEYEDDRLRQLANMEYKVSAAMTARMKDGKYEDDQGEDGFGRWAQIRVELVSFGDVDHDGQDDAVVPISYSEGGRAEYAQLAVVLKKNDKWAVAAVFGIGEGGTPIKQVAVRRSGDIAVTTASFGPDDPYCCPSQTSTTILRLKDGDLRLASAVDEQHAHSEEQFYTDERNAYCVSLREQCQQIRDLDSRMYCYKMMNKNGCISFSPY